MNTANVSPAWLCLHVSKRSVTGISSNSGVGSLDPTANGDQAAPDAGLLLNEGQVQVMGHSHGPLLCLGGPGTGKTTTIVEAAATSSRSTLVLTFARSAADELRERIAARRGSGVLPTVSTFHSLAYSIVNEFGPTDSFGRAPRLLGAPEQEQRVRELLAYAVREGRVRWPSDLVGALGTRGLSKQVRLLLSRAQLLGLSSTQLAKVARGAQIPEWEALSDFLQEYLDVFDSLGVLDYSELMARAVALADEPEIGATLKQRYSTVLVDEYQETDPAQVRLLKALTGPENSLIVFGDPDQAVFGFRGAEVDGILDFCSDFATPDGNPAPVVTLEHSYRFGPAISRAAGRVIARVGLGQLPVEAQRAHRSRRSESQRKGGPVGSVDVVTFESSSAQAASVADRIRRTKLHGQVDRWSDIAVIVRSSAELPTIDYALSAAGIPTSTDVGEVALPANRAVKWLLDVVTVAADSQRLNPAMTSSILAAAPISLDALRYRALSRLVRRAAASLAEEGATEVGATEASALANAEVLIGRALTDSQLASQLPRPESLAVSDRGSCDAEALGAFWTVFDTLAITREGLTKEQSIAEVLWGIWSRTSWCEDLVELSIAGGQAGAAADRDLDAVLSLFALAQEFGGVAFGATAALTFVGAVRAQEISPTTSPGSRRREPRDAVNVLTAHAAKAGQWRQVFVVAAQEGTWPDLRHRPSLLNPERLSASGIEPVPSNAELLADERRLFYVACTRAEEELVLTAVRSSSTSVGSQGDPSRFLLEVAADPSVTATHVQGVGGGGLSMPSMVAQLRAILESGSAENSPALCAAASQRLRELSESGVHSARPDHWWGVRDWTTSAIPVRPVGKPLALSGSSWDSIERCSLRWFLEHEVRAQTARGPATRFGTLVHSVAQAVASGDLPADSEQLVAALRESWDQLGYPSAWQADAELEAAAQAVRRFLAWDASRQTRSLVGTEVEFERTVEVAGDSVRLRGAVDRLEQDEAGALHIVDLKTGRKASTAAQIAQHRQLSLYQVAASEGAFDSDETGRREVGGAELVQLRVGVRGTSLPKVQPQGAIDNEAVRGALGDVVKLIRNEDFRPNPSNATCRSCSFSRVCPASNSVGSDEKPSDAVEGGR